jgi:hypothetical protein
MNRLVTDTGSSIFGELSLWNISDAPCLRRYDGTTSSFSSASASAFSCGHDECRRLASVGMKRCLLRCHNSLACFIMTVGTTRMFNMDMLLVLTVYS